MIAILDQNLKKVEINTFDVGNNQVITKQTHIVSLENISRCSIEIAKRLKTSEAVCIRLRFGGDLFDKPLIVDSQFITKYESLTSSYPFYIPITLQLLKLLVVELGSIPLYAWFETSIFTKLPEEERIYALPNQLQSAGSPRRFGCHGIYHAWNAQQMPNLSTVLSIVMDKQTTVSVLRNGKPRTISMGYTPLEGIMSRTSCGDMDPGIVFHLMRVSGESFFKIDEVLKKNSGFVGLTGIDAEIDELFKQVNLDPTIAQAFELYESQIIRHCGEALAVSGEPQAIVFSGKYTSALTPLIFRILKKFTFLGLSLKPVPWANTSTHLNIVTKENSNIMAAISMFSLPETLYQLFDNFLRRKSA